MEGVQKIGGNITWHTSSELSSSRVALWAYCCVHKVKEVGGFEKWNFHVWCS